ncbi:hypothetical protein, partial [Pedobacter sp.]|uniref:hypothetical protein n=1 Tax=Pedobacter sp. TaxID=1411316 RepID=UPI003C501E4B
MGIILFITAVFLSSVLAPVALLHTVVGAIRYGGKYRYVDSAFLRGAKALDVFGNVAYATFLNDLFIQKGGYHYGNECETISSATGKNWVTGKLTWLGLGLAGTLNLIDKDHCWKYIDGDKDLFHAIGYPGKVKWYYTFSFISISVILFGFLCRFYWWILT